MAEFNPDYVIDNTDVHTARKQYDDLKKATERLEDTVQEFVRANAETAQALEKAETARREAERNPTQETLDRVGAAVSDLMEKYERAQEASEKAGEAQRETEEAREQTAFEVYGPKAREAHIKFERNFVPGFIPFTCDIDVQLGIYRKVVHPGLYFLKSGEDVQNALVYTMIPDTENLQQIAHEHENDEPTTDEDGRKVIEVHDRVEINVNMEPLEVAAGYYLTFLELVAWLAITTAPDDETREAIFSSAYTVEVKEAEAEPELPKQDTVRPRKHVHPITKAAQMLHKLPADGEETGLKVSSAAEEKRLGHKLQTFVTLSYEGEGIKTSKPISKYDTAVSDAVASLWHAGARVVSPEQIHGAMTGGARASARAVSEVTESLDKQMRLMVTIDFTEEMRGKPVETESGTTEVKAAYLEAHMLEARKATIEAKDGTERVGYILSEETPIFLQHAQTTKQLATYPQRLLTATKGVGSNTQTNIKIRSYLLERIEQMKHPHSRMSRKILYATVYENAELGTPDRTEKARYRKYILGCLDAWKREGWIKGYSEYFTGQRADGVEIEV